MTDLCTLAKKHNTDKGDYTPLYHALLHAQRSAVTRVLEVGIGTPETMTHVPGYQYGASLRMWADYFPAALVVGLDRDPCAVDAMNSLGSEHRIRAEVCDQANPQQLRNAVRYYGTFDLIVDDGSHEPEHQLLTCKTLYPYLTRSGLYVIEDVNDFDFLCRSLPFRHFAVGAEPRMDTSPRARCIVIFGGQQ